MIASDRRAARAFLQAAAVLALAVSATTAFAQTNLLQNGSFESSYFNDSTAAAQGIGYASPQPNGAAANATIPSWTWSPGAYIPSTFALNQTGGALGVTAEDGTYSVSFGTGSAQSGGSISQSFAVTSGAHGTLSFWVRRIGGGQGISAKVQVTDNSNSGAQVTLTDSANTSYVNGYTVPIPGSPNVWSQVVLKFTAPSSNLTFTFTDTTPLSAADSTDLGLDNVSITQKTLQTLTFYGGVGNQGDIAANTEYSNDNDATWHPAYLSGPHPWGFLPGTTSWINQSSSPFVGLYQTTDFRIKFNLPAEFEDGSMAFQVNADNHGELSINSTVLSSTDGGYTPSLITADGSSLLPGEVNILKIRLTDYGGWVGINYVLTLTGYAYSAPTVVVLPPVITGSTSASGTVGVPFSFQLTGGNNPTSFSAGSLPPGLSISTTGLISGTPTMYGTYTSTIAEGNSGGTTTGTLTITISKGTATVTLGGLAQVYDGTVKSATATTNPGNLTVSFSYTGAALPPVNAGIYGVLGAISDSNYSGSASGNMTIAKAPLSITFGNLTQTFSGATHPVTVTTTPSGIATTAVTYNGSISAPANVGNYSVAASSADSNYSGSANATLTITAQPTTITFGNTTQSFDGTPKSVTTSTSPTANIPLTVTYNGQTAAPSAVGNYTVSAVTADSNYSGSATTTLQIKDTTPPVITIGSNFSAEAVLAAGAPVSFSGSATDNVDGSDAVTYSIPSGSVFPIGTTNVTASSTDAAGNTSSTNFAVTVSDTTPPIITGTPWATESFSSYSGIQSSLQYQSGLKVAYAGTIGGWTASGFHAVHAVDRSGSGDWAIMIYNDNVITQSIGVAANNAGTNYVVTFVASPAVYAAPSQATTTADGLIVQVLRANGTVLASYTAQPGAWAGNLSFSGYSFTYAGDGSGPVQLRVSSLAPADGRFGGAIDDVAIADATPATLSLEATSASGAVANFSEVAVDRVSGYTAVTANPASGSTFAIGTNPVTLVSTDAAGNKATASFNVVVKDTTSPTISAPSDMIVEATSAAGATVNFAATASDIVDGNVAVTASPASGSMFPLGRTTVTLTATDAHGNVATKSFSVTVQDTTPPAIAAQDNLVVEATSADGAAVEFSPSATDIVDGSVAVTATPKSGSTFPIGTTTVTLTATDAAGNTATRSFTVTVRDTTPPTIAGPGNLVAEATSAAGAAVTFNATANDIVDGADAVTASPASGSTFALGTTTVTLTSTDKAGNTSTSSFTVTVRDTTPPKLTVPTNMTVEATSASGAVATYAASATDAVTASPTIGYSKTSGSIFPLGTTTVNVTATDAAGNVSNGSFTVTVRDTTPPALTLPTNQVLEATTAAGAVATYTASATDAVTASPAIAYSIASGSTFPLGTTTVNVTATDAANNVAKGSFTVTVRDTTPPALTVPQNMTLEATSAAGAVANFAASATDAVTASPTITYSVAPGSTFAIGTTTVNVTAADAAGNKSTGSFTVTVRDTTPPTISSISASPNTIWPPNKKMVPVTITVGSSDIVGVASVKIVSVTTNEPDGTVQWAITGDLTLNLKADRLGTGNGRIYTITVEARDAAGNATQKAVTVTVPHDQGK